MIKAMFAQGYDFASLLADARLLANSVAAQLAAARDRLATEVKGYRPAGGLYRLAA